MELDTSYLFYIYVRSMYNVFQFYDISHPSRLY